nr:hypothetical protein [Pandoravirus massiliensis]
MPVPASPSVVAVRAKWRRARRVRCRQTDLIRSNQDLFVCMRHKDTSFYFYGLALVVQQSKDRRRPTQRVHERVGKTIPIALPRGAVVASCAGAENLFLPRKETKKRYDWS